MKSLDCHPSSQPQHLVWRYCLSVSLPAPSLLVSTQLARALALSLVIACSPTSAQTQSSATLPMTSPAAQWRALSRFGYGPTARDASHIGNARVWALAELDTASTASRKPPAIPTDYADINQHANSITRLSHEERENRRLARIPAQGMPSATSMPPSMSNANGAQEVSFERDMAQHTQMWRLMSCSDSMIEHPLLSRMTEFWFNHFNVYMSKGPVRPFTGHYVINAIRSNALGRFEDLLLATAQHPAMLLYLDQAQSNVRGLNENYARELMELHTLGVRGGYTQTDVRELARVLTGWSVAFAQGQAFLFRPGAHDTGSKVLLGQTIAGRSGSEGFQEGIEAIRILARHPATAQRVAARLASFFVMDAPTPELVQRLASSFTSSGGDIMTVMRTLMDSPELWHEHNTLFKTPYDFVCSSLAASGGIRHEREARQAIGFLAQAGQPLHNWQTPDGYKTDRASWLAPEALTRRADYAMSLGTRIEEPQFLQMFMGHASRERIAREPIAAIRSGLMLASPDFMHK